MKNWIAVLALLFLVLSCEDGKKTYRASSSGPLSLVSVFSTPEMYAELEEAMSDTLVFGKVFPGLYYPPEMMFATRNFEPKDFSGFRKTRLILDVKTGETPEILFAKDSFARPQAYVMVKGKSADEIADLLRANQDSLLRFYRDADKAFLLDGFRDKAFENTAALDSLGVQMVVPNNYKLVEANPSFVWYRKDQFNTIQNKNESDQGIVTQQSHDILNILLYKVEYDKPAFTMNDVIQLRDSVLAVYTKGDKEPVELTLEDGSKKLVTDHIQTEKNPILMDMYDFELLTSEASENVYETQGYWSMTLTQMGGPYTMKIIWDKEKKELYVVDAVMFAPLNQGKSKKRDYLIAMESLFNTFKIKE